MSLGSQTSSEREVVSLEGDPKRQNKRVKLKDKEKRGRIHSQHQLGVISGRGGGCMDRPLPTKSAVEEW